MRLYKLNNLDILTKEEYKIFSKYKSKYRWGYISTEENLSGFFIEKYKGKLDWYSIAVSYRISKKFEKKYNFYLIGYEYLLKHNINSYCCEDKLL